MRSNSLENFLALMSSKKFMPMVICVCLLMSLSVAPGCKKDGDDPPPGNGQVTPNLQLVADGMVAPLGVVEAPDGSKRLFIIDQPGRVWIVKNGTRLSVPFIDISSKMVTLTPQYDERGLLGLAFHPNYATNGKFYLFYTAPPNPGGPEPGVAWNNLTRISEFKVSSNADVADLSSERIILQADHPQMNHDGGTIAFGPDGYLYISIGDGGGANDVGPGHVSDWYAVNEGGNAQNIFANLMGKILRIDVNSGNPYAIPSDNPFVNTGGARPEIYAYGLRNPYRFSFDMGGARQLFAGDAGQKLFEEINIINKGGNYGWNVKEGTACFNAENNLLIRPSCPSVDSLGNPLIDPMIQLKNAAHPEGGGLATVIVGGHVYRGNALPNYTGRYIFGIFSQSLMQADGKIFAATGTSGNYEQIVLKDFPNHLGMYLKGFGQDLSGEIYLTTSGDQGVAGTTGKVYKLIGSQ